MRTFENANDFIDHWCTLEYEIVTNSWEELKSLKRKKIYSGQKFVVMDDFIYLQLLERAIDGTLTLEDTDLIDDYCDVVLSSWIKLHFNTVMCGHDSYCPNEWLKSFEVGGIPKKKIWQSNIVDFIEEDALSDYGLAPIANLLTPLFLQRNYSLKMQILTEIIGVTHMRGDIARFFIKTGRKVYNNITVYDYEDVDN